MASTVNKVILVGNLGAAPELKYLAGGHAVCELRVATSESWIDKNSGEKREKTEWHRVVLWGKSAENAAKFLGKGSKVYVEGKIETRNYDDKEGNKRYITEIRASEIGFLDSKRGGAIGGEAFSHSEAPAVDDVNGEIPF